MVKKIIVKKKMTDKEISEREGEYFDEDHYDIIVNSDTDVYTDTGELFGIWIKLITIIYIFFANLHNKL